MRFDRSQDGRGTFSSIKIQAEGRYHKLAKTNAAFETVKSKKFDGLSKTYMFNDYVRVHLTAHNHLKECNEELSEEAKIWFFLDRIFAEPLQHGIWLIDSQPERYPDFETVQQYLNTVLISAKIRSPQPQTSRNVASTGSSNPKKPGSGKGPRSPGKKKAKGNKHIPPKIWNSWTPEQKTKHIDECKKNASVNMTPPRQTSMVVRSPSVVIPPIVPVVVPPATRTYAAVVREGSPLPSSLTTPMSAVIFGVTHKPRARACSPSNKPGPLKKVLRFATDVRPAATTYRVGIVTLPDRNNRKQE
jgi:hypothetical protein